MENKKGSSVGKCIIVAAGDAAAKLIPSKGDEDLLIAVDAGYRTLVEAGLAPDVFIGDGDSLGYIPELEDATVLPKIKNDTDTVAAVKLGLARGYRRFELYGALGGRRPSHSVSNLQTLLFIDSQGAKGVIADERCTCRILSAAVDPEISVEQNGGYFSLFAVGGDAVVTVRGAKYEVERESLSPSFPLGVSNSFVGESAEIPGRFSLSKKMVRSLSVWLFLISFAVSSAVAPSMMELP